MKFWKRIRLSGEFAAKIWKKELIKFLCFGICDFLTCKANFKKMAQELDNVVWRRRNKNESCRSEFDYRMSIKPVVLFQLIFGLCLKRSWYVLVEISRPENILQIVFKGLGAFWQIRIWALDVKLFTGFIYSSQYTTKVMLHTPGNFCNYKNFELLLYKKILRSN